MIYTKKHFWSAERSIYDRKNLWSVKRSIFGLPKETLFGLYKEMEVRDERVERVVSDDIK